MNKRWIYLLLPGVVLLSGCLTTLCVAADQTTAAKKWSLEECINTALRNQGAVLTSEQTVFSSKAALTQAKGDYYPTITLQSMPLSLSGGRGAYGGGSGGTTTNGTSVSVTQNIYDSGLREMNVKAKQYGVKSSEDTLQRQRQTTENNVISAFYNAWLAMRKADLQDTTVKDLVGQLDMINTRVQVGDAAVVDAYPVEASLANAKVAQLSAKNTIQTQLVALQDAMGLQPGGDFDIQEVSAPKQELLDPLDKYLGIALKSRPDFQAFAAQIIAAKAEEQAAKINIWPHVSVNGAYDQRIDNSSQNAWSITGGLVYTVFDGHILHAEYQQTQAAVKSAQIAAVQLAKDIASQVEQAYLNLSSAQQNLGATAVGLTASQKNYEAQQGRYKEGLATPQDLLDAEVQVATATNNQWQAQYNYYTAKAALEYATGKQGGLNGK